MGESQASKRKRCRKRKNRSKPQAPKIDPKTISRFGIKPDREVTYISASAFKQAGTYKAESTRIAERAAKKQGWESGHVASVSTRERAGRILRRAKGHKNVKVEAPRFA